MDSSLAGDLALLVGAALLTAAALLSWFAERFRAPALLLFLGLGMAVGDDGLGLISFDDAELAQQIGVVALVVILFEGGLGTSVADVRRLAAPAGLLATFGVVLTAGAVAGLLVLATDVSTTTALLIGAVVASTDAAAVFAVLRRAPVPPRVASLLEVESGGNDPMAVLLTIGVLAGWESDPEPLDWVVFGLVQLVGGLAIGGVVGWAAGRLLRWFPSDTASFRPVLALGAAGLSYGVGAAVGASGFLAAFVAGLVIGTTSPRHRRAVRRFAEGLASIAQVGLFLMLGLLVFPSQLPDVLGVGIVTTVALIVVARPLAVFSVLPWFGFRTSESTLVAWAGLRGAVPIVLATIPLTSSYPDGSLVFDAVFFVVLVSAVVQGLTIPTVARRLGLAHEEGVRPAVADLVPLDTVGVDVVEVELDAHHEVVDRSLRAVPLPGKARVGAILRGDVVEVPDGDSVLQAGDLLIVVTPSRDELADQLERWAAGEQVEHEPAEHRRRTRRRPARADD